MILEAVPLNVTPGQEQEFESAFERAQAIVSASPGYLSHQLQKCLEHENRYLLLIRWETLEAHTEGFRGSPEFQEWKALLHHFYDSRPEVLHYKSLFEGTK